MRHFSLQKSTFSNAVSRKLRVHARDRQGRKHEEFAEIFVAFSGTTTKHMNNAKRNYATCLQYPKTRHFYIALTLQAFKKIICY